MNSNPGILVDLDRCVGCYACEVACKQEHPNTHGVPWIRVHTIGPEIVNGKLIMDYIPRISDGCDFCQSRALQPTCVAHCPTKALSVSSGSSIRDVLNSSTRYQLCNTVDMK